MQKLCALLLLVVSVGFAHETTTRTTTSASLLGVPNSTLSNINNIAVWLRDDGWSSRNPSSGNSGLTFPRSTATAIFQDGFLWGGNVNDGGSQVLRVGGQTYSVGTQRGRIVSIGVPEPAANPDVRIFRVRTDYQTADVTQDAAEYFQVPIGLVTDTMRDSIRRQYTRDWNEWPWQKGAPFYDLNNNGTREANEPPGLANADQVVWFVANDLNPTLTNALYGSNPVGLEMQVTVWAYNSTDARRNSIFKRARLIYKGTATTPTNATISDLYLTQWSDPDVGDAGNDYVGCDTTLSMMFGYNATPTDTDYVAFGLAPPAVGYKILQGPIVPGAPTDSAIFNFRKIRGRKNLPMSAAINFGAGGTISDPPFSRTGALQWYNLMKGLHPITGAGFIHPSFPSLGPTKFWLDGNPVTGTGRRDGLIEPASDRRTAATSGPFTMALGDTQEIVMATIGGISTTNLASVTAMKSNATAVQTFWNQLVGITTGVRQESDIVPSVFSLEQNYPNPFNPTTTLRFQIADSRFASLKVFDLVGKEVATLVREHLKPGEYSVEWNAVNFPSGAYVARLESGGFSSSRKLLLLK